MGRFIVSLTDAERERLEQHRALLGLRSHADVIRRWIAGKLPLPEKMIDPVSGGFTKEAERAYDVAFGPPRAAPGSRLKKR